MGTQTSAIIKGFDYQHLLSWYHVLSLKKKNEAVKIKLEDSDAGYVDDLTVYKNDGIDFYQVKYHVNAGNYSFESILNVPKGNSLLEKFWITWKKLIQEHPGKKIRLILYSNWVQHPDDVIFACISLEDGILDKNFFDATPVSACGKKRDEWQKKHKATDKDFFEFTKAISFHLGRNVSEELKKMISDRMELLNLKHDDSALLVAQGIIKEWIKNKVKDITVDTLEEKLKQYDLYLPKDSERAVTINFTTIKDRKFDLQPDYSLDWRKYFKQVSGKGDHELIDNGDWNNKMLPELYNLENEVNEETGVKLVRARGYSRLSPWFAFGFTFSEVNGYTIETNQQGSLCRTDVKPSTDFEIVSDTPTGEQITGNDKTVAVGISITGSLEGDVRKYLNESKDAANLLLLKPKVGAASTVIRNAGDVKALALQAKEKIREYVKAKNAERLLLFYFGPLSGACFIGHQLNAVCKSVQIMENTSGNSYTPSFILQ